jgi:preprotein translocase subunit YajC
MPEIILFGFIFLLILGAYWALVVYPKQRNFQKRQRYVNTLNPGEEVITYGGIIGKVVEVEADKGIAHVEISDGIIVRLVTAALMQPYDPEALAQSAQLPVERRPPTE